MISAEQGLAAVTLAACVVLGVRLYLSPARRQRLDQSWHRAAAACRRVAWRLRHGSSARRQARAEAEAAIQRARSGSSRRNADDGSWTGNVYTPKAFGKPRRPDQLH